LANNININNLNGCLIPGHPVYSSIGFGSRRIMIEMVLIKIVCVVLSELTILFFKCFFVVIMYANRNNGFIAVNFTTKKRIIFRVHILVWPKEFLFNYSNRNNKFWDSNHCYHYFDSTFYLHNLHMDNTLIHFSGFFFF